MKQTSATSLCRLLLAPAILYFGASCNNTTELKTADVQTARELATMDSLLRDAAFADTVARALEAAYYEGTGQGTPPFLMLGEEDSVVVRPLREEKIATSLAGFYGLECGVETLCAQTGETPTQWLQKVVDGSADSNATLLLNRFANATWKAGQPFRDMARLMRPNFIGYGGLSKEEVEKDAIQIRNAATKLSDSLQGVKAQPLEEQMKALRGLMQDTAYAAKMAAYLDSTFAVSQGQTPSPFPKPGDDTVTVRKSARAIKVATNLAGFYAAECATNYLVTVRKLSPSTVLKALLDGKLSKEDQDLFARFANATWKAGQPFRGLERIKREAFTPFYFLPQAEVQKDLVQVKAAAKLILERL